MSVARRLLGGRERPPRLATGERVLAWCHVAEPPGTVLAGTRDALHVLPRGPVIGWHEVEAADWSAESEVLRVSEVGTWGEQRPEHRFTLAEPGTFLQLVRERVSATVVLQRHVPLQGARGVRVIARRATSGDREIRWFHEYDRGVDPDDPAVRAAAREALRLAREEVGL